MTRTESGQELSDFDAPDLSPQDHAEHIAGIVSRAIESTGLMQVKEVKATVGKIHLLGRVVDENKKDFVQKFGKGVWRRVNTWCDIFLGTQYFPYKGDVENIMYGWVFAFSTENLMEACKEICAVAEELTPRTDTMEVPLMGPSTPQGGGGRKGAREVRG
jgi:hypothetical protein